MLRAMCRSHACAHNVVVKKEQNSDFPLDSTENKSINKQIREEEIYNSFHLMKLKSDATFLYLISVCLSLFSSRSSNISMGTKNLQSCGSHVSHVYF